MRRRRVIWISVAIVCILISIGIKIERSYRQERTVSELNSVIPGPLLTGPAIYYDFYPDTEMVSIEDTINKTKAGIENPFNYEDFAKDFMEMDDEEVEKRTFGSYFRENGFFHFVHRATAIPVKDRELDAHIPYLKRLPYLRFLLLDEFGHSPTMEARTHRERTLTKIENELPHVEVVYRELPEWVPNGWRY